MMRNRWQRPLMTPRIWGDARVDVSSWAMRVGDVGGIGRATVHSSVASVSVAVELAAGGVGFAEAFESAHGSLPGAGLSERTAGVADTPPVSDEACLPVRWFASCTGGNVTGPFVRSSSGQGMPSSWRASSMSVAEFAGQR